jgi:hypothetical protein
MCVVVADWKKKYENFWMFRKKALEQKYGILSDC